MSFADLIFIVFLAAGPVVCCSGEQANITFRCIATERNALIKFKASFSDPYDKLSWNTGTKLDCCDWHGVKCDTITGHVIGLDLGYKELVTEKLDSSIVELKHLSFLDVSGNDFQSSSIPDFVGSMNQLQHLNLSYAYFGGVIPHHLGNLTRLSVLDLTHNDDCAVDDLMWLSRLPSLTYLGMSGVDISGTKHLLEVLNILPHLVDLGLSSCGLENKDLLLASLINSSRFLSNIQYLDLSQNSFHGELPYFLENMTSLTYLDLSYNSYDSCNQFHLTRLTNLVHLDLSHNSCQCNVDSISEFVSNKCHLQSLYLGENFFFGDISRLFRLNTSSCWNQKLATIDLSWNNFYGQLPKEIGRFGNLKYLDMQSNLVSGPIPLSLFNLSLLTVLDLSNNTLKGSIPPTFGNLTSLISLNLDNNALYGEIPASLGQLQNLETLEIDNNHFDGIISEAHFAKLSMLRTFSVENNFIKLRVKSDWTPPFQLTELNIGSCEIIGGQFPKWLQTQKELEVLFMRNCSISGPFPNWFWYKNMTSLDLSENNINGSIPDSLCEMTYMAFLYLSNNHITGSLPHSFSEMNSLGVVDLSNNHIKGSLPHSLCEMTSINILDLSMNRVSGSLPECSWADLTQLYALILSSNQLSGVIPNNIGEASSLRWLQLSNNSFNGELPSTLRNCKHLHVLDIGQNTVSGKLPKWIGRYLLNLRVLRLVNNDMFGTIPVELCRLSQLQILDVANNKLTGYIPSCFGNFSGMVFSDSTYIVTYQYGFGVLSVMKGLGLEYLPTLSFVVNLDLSSNALEGEIPLELTKLAALHGLNLSHNHLGGMIPGSIGEMKSLESLDLSNNYLFGNIPGNLSGLTSLSYLNLSHNNLTGEIPTGNQLQTLVDPWSYEGNPGLCGDPLPKKCHEKKAASTPNAVSLTEDEDKIDTIWFYGVVISGFATGFWGAIGVLVFKHVPGDGMDWEMDTIMLLERQIKEISQWRYLFPVDVAEQCHDKAANAPLKDLSIRPSAVTKSIPFINPFCCPCSASFIMIIKILSQITCGSEGGLSCEVSYFKGEDPTYEGIVKTLFSNASQIAELSNEPSKAQSMGMGKRNHNPGVDDS